MLDNLCKEIKRENIERIQKDITRYFKSGFNRMCFVPSLPATDRNILLSWNKLLRRKVLLRIHRGSILPNVGLFHGSLCGKDPG